MKQYPKEFMFGSYDGSGSVDFTMLFLIDAVLF